MDGFAEFIATCVVVVAIISGMLFPIRALKHHLDVSRCDQYTETTGFETKFQDWNFFKWDCLAKTNNGRWVPIDKLREVD